MDRGVELRRLFGVFLIVFLFAAVSACNGNEKAGGDAASSTEQTGSNSTSTDESAEPIAGNEVFQKSCISCHSSGDISGGHTKLDAAVIQSSYKTQEELFAYVSERMPLSAPGSLTEEEYQAVVKYLWDQK